MVPSDFYTQPVALKITPYVAENVKGLIWTALMDPGMEGFKFNSAALQLLGSRFEYLSGDNDGGHTVIFQLHELVSFVHFIDAMVAVDGVADGERAVSHRTKELQRECVKEVLTAMDPSEVSSIIGAVDVLHLEREDRRNLEAKLKDGGARNLNWEYSLRKIEADALRIRFDLKVNLDPELYPHTQVSPVGNEAE